jgi:hypothetical protein
MKSLSSIVMGLMVLASSIAGCLDDYERQIDSPYLPNFESVFTAPPDHLGPKTGLGAEIVWSFSGEKGQTFGPSGWIEDAYRMVLDDGVNQVEIFLHPESFEPISIVKESSIGREFEIPRLHFTETLTWIQFIPLRLLTSNDVVDHSGTLDYIGHEFDYVYVDSDKVQFRLAIDDSLVTHVWQFDLFPGTPIPERIDRWMEVDGSIPNGDVPRTIHSTRSFQAGSDSEVGPASIESTYADRPRFALHTWDRVPPEIGSNQMPWKVSNAIGVAAEKDDEVASFLERQPHWFVSQAAFVETELGNMYTWSIRLSGHGEDVSFVVDDRLPFLDPPLNSFFLFVDSVETSSTERDLTAYPTRPEMTSMDDIYQLCNELVPERLRRVVGYADFGGDGHDQMVIGGINQSNPITYVCGPYQIDALTGFYTNLVVAE